MDRVRCKLLAVWKTCVQTDWQTGCGGAISGVELEDRAARDERRRVTGPAVTLFKTLSPSPFFIPSPSISPPTPPENHGSSRLQDLTKKKMNSVVVFLKEYSTEESEKLRRIRTETQNSNWHLKMSRFVWPTIQNSKDIKVYNDINTQKISKIFIFDKLEPVNIYAIFAWENGSNSKSSYRNCCWLISSPSTSHLNSFKTFKKWRSGSSFSNVRL